MIITNGAAELTCPWCSHTANFQINPQHADEDIGLHCRKCSRFSSHKVAHPVFDSHNKKLKDSREVWKRIPPEAYVTCRQSSQGTQWTYTIYLGKGMPEEFTSRDVIEHMMIKEFGMTWEQANAAILSASLTPGQKCYFQRLTKISAEIAERMEKTAVPEYRQGQAVRVSGLDGLFLRHSPEPGFAIVAFPGIGDQEVPVIEFEVMDTGDSPEEVGFEMDPLEHGLEEGAEAMGAGDIVEEIENAAAAVDQMLQHETNEGEEDEAGERDLLEEALEDLEEAKDALMDFSMEEAEESEELFEDDGFEPDEEPEFEVEHEEPKEEKFEEKHEAGREFPHPKMCAGCQKKHRGTGAYCGNCKNERKAWWSKAPWEIDEMTPKSEPADTTEEADEDTQEDADNWVAHEDDQYPEYAKDLEKGKDKKEANREAQRRVHTHYGHSGDLKRAIAVNLDDLSIRDIREVLAFYANTGKIDSNTTAAIASEFIGDRSVRRLSAGDLLQFDPSKRRNPVAPAQKDMVTVYNIPNGHQDSAEWMYKWLLNPGEYGVQFHPQWGPFEGGNYIIQLPANEVEQLRQLQRKNPARWGNPTASRVAVAPPGREDQVKELKKQPGIDNPFAVAWSSYDKSHDKKPKKKADIQSEECVNCGKTGAVDARGRCAKCARGNAHTAVISGSPGSYHVKSEKGKNLGGPYKSKEQAEHRLKQVEYFKHKDSALHTAVDADDDGYGQDADGQSCEQCGQKIASGSLCASCSNNPQNVEASRHEAMLSFGLGIFQPALYKGKEVLVIHVDNTSSRVTVQDARKRMFTVDAADLSPTKIGPYTRKPR